MHRLMLSIAALTWVLTAGAQQPYRSSVWSPDNGDGTYKNPVLYADYSDPDAIRVGSDFYLIASSFVQSPGIPILHSKDLVNWEIIAHALPALKPAERYDAVQHGGGVWAPALRFHNNEFYIYYPDPDLGIYLIKSKNITGPWSEPKQVIAGRGFIDPCPFWDNDGRCYLVHAFAGSRAGIKSILVMRELNAAGDTSLSADVLVYDGHEIDPTVEGPKLYKRNQYYYIFAPAGGVSTGWQLALRSNNIYGPYERKLVLAQGKTTVNGPHQGAWVNTGTGQDWFLHFQDQEAYGRVVHLQPMSWKNDWPVIGTDPDGDGTGEPVLQYKKPDLGKTNPVMNPAENDEFSSPSLGLQWQWEANPHTGWAFPSTNGYLTLFSVPVLQQDSIPNPWYMSNILGQKFPAPEFTATAKFRFKPLHEGEQFSMIVLGTDYEYISVEKRNDRNYISMAVCQAADKGGKQTMQDIQPAGNADLYFRVQVKSGARCSFSFSEDGIHFTTAGTELTAKPGQWIGARLGFFFTCKSFTNDAGQVQLDWIRFTKNE